MAALMSCMSLCVFCCILRNIAFGGRSVALFMDHGTMSHQGGGGGVQMHFFAFLFHFSL